MPLPRYLFEFRGYEIASEAMANTMLLGGPKTRVLHVRISIYSAHCVIQPWFQLSDCLLISQATPFTDEACKTIFFHLEECKFVKRKIQEILYCIVHTVFLLPFGKFQLVTCVLGDLVWSSAKQLPNWWWLKQKESGGVETWLIRPAATALCRYLVLF